MEPRFRIRAYPTADRYLRRSTLRIALSETTPDNLMRFYDTNIVAARPNLAFMPFGARTAPLFRCGDGLSAGAIPARPDPSEIPDTNAPGLGFPARSRPAVAGRRQ